MKKRQSKSLTAAAVILTFTMAPFASAALLVDIGDTTGYVGTNTPAHEDGGLSASENTYFAFKSGTATTTAFSSTITLRDARNFNNSGDDAEEVRDFATTANTPGAGVFGTELTEDAGASLVTTVGNFRAPLGLEVAGLPDGIYTAYIVAHFGGNLGDVLRTYAGVAAANDNVYLTSDFTFQDSLTGTTTSSWVEGNNYSALNFTIAGGNSFYLMVDDSTDGSSTYNSTLSSLEIIAIPEPSTLVLLGLGGLAMIAALRRRK